LSDFLGIFIPSIGQCGYAIQAKHTHPAYSFVVTFEATSPLIPKGFKVKHDEFAVIAMTPDTPHEEPVSQTFNRYAAIMIERLFFEKQYALYSSTPFCNASWFAFSTPKQVMTHIKTFIAEESQSIPGRDEIRNGCANIITHQLIRSLCKTNQPNVSEISSRFEIASAVEFMHQHFSNKIILSDLARAATMSTPHFLRIFKEELHASPMEYLLKIRIEKSKHFIRLGTKRLTDIARECGFSDSAYFSSCFKKVEGISPREYSL
jgi:AraC family transcriptional regulator